MLANITTLKATQCYFFDIDSGIESVLQPSIPFYKTLNKWKTNF